MTSKEELLTRIQMRLFKPDFSLADLQEMKSDIQLLEYLLTPKSGWMEPLKIMISSKMVCSVCGNKPNPTLWNISKEGQSVWYCLEHIPSHITFPIALHGEDFLKSGRKIPQDPRDSNKPSSKDLEAKEGA